MTFFKPLPRSVTRPVSILIIVGWVVAMAVLVNRSYLHSAAANLATDLARYGSHAEWRVLSQNLTRLLAGGRLRAGSEQQWTIFDPATLRNAPVTVNIGNREVERNTGERPIPAFRVEMEYQGLRTTSWITDTGDVVREESPLGLITVRESADRAQTLAVPGRMQTDL